MGIFDAIARIFDPLVNLLFPREPGRRVKRRGIAEGMRPYARALKESGMQRRPVSAARRTTAFHGNIRERNTAFANPRMLQRGVAHSPQRVPLGAVPPGLRMFPGRQNFAGARRNRWRR